MDYLAILKEVDASRGLTSDQRPAPVERYEKNEIYEKRFQLELSPPVQPPGPAYSQAKCTGACRYDWLPGYRGLRLHCVAHQSHAASTTVFRMTWSGHDTLQELLRLGFLTGDALADAR